MADGQSFRELSIPFSITVLLFSAKVVIEEQAG
jgi:hypothetical protein